VTREDDSFMATEAKPRILFVDDDRHVLDALRRMFRPHVRNWEMVFHIAPPDALEEQKRQPFDVAVVDMRMPTMTGLELIQALNGACPATICMILTGAADMQTAIAAINEANVFRFYTKPCAATVLATGIEEALARRHTAAAAQPAAPSAETAFGMATLNRLPTGVVVVDRRLQVLFTNSRGAELLAGGDGFTLGATGICRTARPTETGRLQRLVAQAVEDGSTAPRVGALSLTRESGARPLPVVVAPMATRPGEEPVAVLLISDPENQTLPSAETIGQLFELTEAEARLALALAEGRRVEEAAEFLGITANSARTYLKRIFGKTGVGRQAELVRLIVAAPSLVDLVEPRPQRKM
jgi:DNA-binding NarL/FixJ family response regulator